MLKPQVHQSKSAQALFLHKPFIHGSAGSSSIPVWSRPSFIPEKYRSIKATSSSSSSSDNSNTPTSTTKTTTTTTRTTTTPIPNPTTPTPTTTTTTTIVTTEVVTKKFISVKATLTVTLTVGGFLSNLGLNRGLDDITDLLGHSLLLEFVSAELDPKTGEEKEKVAVYAHRGRRLEGEIIYETPDFKVPVDFGEIGAILVENEHHKEMFLKEIVVDGLPCGSVHLSCNSWIHSKYDNPEKRVFFTNKSYLPSQTPSGLVKLREEELVTLRGNGQGERRSFERIYDYDVYNDLGDPDKDLKLKRPVLGGKEFPCPRRCRTGRPPCDTYPLSEKRTRKHWYVPRDEAFSEVKQLTFSAKTVYSVMHALVPSLEMAISDTNLGFKYFTAIDSLFHEGIHLPPFKEQGVLKALLPRLVNVMASGDDVLRFVPPETMNRTRSLVGRLLQVSTHTASSW